MRQILLKKPDPCPIQAEGRRSETRRPWWHQAITQVLCVIVMFSTWSCREKYPSKRSAKTHPSAGQANPNQRPPYHGPFGQVSSVQPKIYENPSNQSPLLGWARKGSAIPISAITQKGPGCTINWRKLAHRGWICGDDISIQDAKASSATTPIHYFFIKDAITPEYFRVPSKKEHALVLGLIDRFRKLRAQDPSLADRFARGDRHDVLKHEPLPPVSMKRFLQRGFYIAGYSWVRGSGVASHESFLLTVRGTYVWQAALEEKALPTFHGFDLQNPAENAPKRLPIAWVTRGVRPMVKATHPDGTVVFRDLPEDQAIARYAIVPWVKREYYGTKWVHQLINDQYLHPWFLAVAEFISPPRFLKKDERWIHIDRGEQTLVVYQGHVPIYATLVSTGIEGFETPLGEYTIRAKFLSDSMGDIGADSPDARYSIDDVPYAMYFKGALAMHGTFWHDRFGLRRSHGCVNLAPNDAAWIFAHTQPQLPQGWHGISTRDVKIATTRIVITD